MESRQQWDRTELPRQEQGSANRSGTTRKDKNNDKEEQGIPESADVLGADEDFEGGRGGEEDGKLAWVWGRTRKDENNDKEKQGIPENTDVLGADEDFEGGREGEDGK